MNISGESLSSEKIITEWNEGGLASHDAICVLVIDKNRLFRDGLKMLLRGSSFVVAGEASSAGQIDATVSRDTPPDIVLLSIEAGLDRGERDGVSTIAQVKALLPSCCVVALSDALCMQQLTAALESGADGFLLKDIAPEALKQSLLLALSGEKVLPAELVRVLIDSGVHHNGPGTQNPATAALSDREKQILSCLMKGMSNKAIAYQLSITEGTVKVHLKGVLKKINARNRTQAAIWGMNNGLSFHEKARGGDR